MSRRFTSKGFIGPIGDDLPSLIPIMVALVVFFTIFATTLATFNSKNGLISKEIEMTSVARELKGDSLLLKVDDFKQKCSNVKAKKFPYNFVAAIYSSEKDLSKSTADFAEISLNGDDSTYLSDDLFKEDTDSGTKYYSCGYKKIGAKAFTGNEKRYLLRYYPIAVQVEKIGPNNEKAYVVVPAIMAMVVWE